MAADARATRLAAVEGARPTLHRTHRAAAGGPLAGGYARGRVTALRRDAVCGAVALGAVVGVEGKEKLRAAALEQVRKIVKTEGGKPESVDNVYFTSFVMQ